MKRYLMILPALMLCLALSLFIGCSDDDDGTIVNTITGDNNDPDLAMFMEEFEDMDDLTGTMFDLTFGMFIDSILNTAHKPQIPTGPNLSITYHPDSKFWICELEEYNSFDSTTMYFTDSIQFLHGEAIVQWPDPGYLSELRSYLTLVVTGNHLDTAIAHQNLVVTVDNPGSDTIVVNGSQDLYASYDDVDIDMNDTTICETDVNYNIAINSLIVDMDSDDGPYSGSITYTGTLSVNCTGAHPGSVSGSWSVVQTFTPNGVNLSITHNNTVWTITDW
ncbi:MAG: hypothetical protein GY841_06830 [FCB group bacterium]|nr:hypothetical protein [FCB group bacterium]